MVSRIRVKTKNSWMRTDAKHKTVNGYKKSLYVVKKISPRYEPQISKSEEFLSGSLYTK